MSSDTLAKAPAPPLPEAGTVAITGLTLLPQAMRSIVPPAGNLLIGTLRVIPLLMVATVRYTIVTSLFGPGRYYVEKHYARGTEPTR